MIKKQIIIKSLIWIFLAGNIFFGSLGVAKTAMASPVCKNGQIDIDMQTIYAHQRSQGSYSVCIDNSAYNPGESINIYADLYNTGMPVCGNLVNWQWVKIKATTNGRTIDLIKPQWYGANPVVSGSGTIPAPNKPGKYEVVVDIIINIGDDIPDGIYREIIPYEVIDNACIPDCSNNSNVCAGDHYDDGCDGACWGTKNCSISAKLTASPNPIKYNSSSNLIWTTLNAASCSASGAWAGPKSAGGGTEPTGNLTFDQTYSIECWNSDGDSSGIKSVTVYVGDCVADSSCADSQCTTYQCFDDCGIEYWGKDDCCNIDCTCAAETCIGKTCPDGCGGTCVGNKKCTWREEAP